MTEHDSMVHVDCSHGSEKDPLKPQRLKVGDADLEPISEPVSFASRLAICLKTTFVVLLATFLVPVGIALFFAATATGIAPLIEHILSKRDDRALSRENILKEHPEMFLLAIPAGVNDASLGHPYHVMVRLTRPTVHPDPPLPPVIFPGGLASNLMTMSRHQDELTRKHGFTVVNFDRLGVGLSDPFSCTANDLRSPTAADVAREMDYVMKNCGVTREEDGVPKDRITKWIQVGGSMGTNVATAFVALFPGRLCGFLNLDGLPHAFLQIQCKKFLDDGPKLMNFMRSIRWTGLPRLAFSAALRPVIPALGNAFDHVQIIGAMCRDQFFTATALEYTTLMSCCDLECAAWGPQATTEYDKETMFLMVSLKPEKTVIVDQVKGLQREECNERSSSELGNSYINRTDPIFVEFESRFRALALTAPNQVDETKTNCNWPDPPRHPVGDTVGGIRPDDVIHPLAQEFSHMVVRVMCARDYKGLERDYIQTARNHAAARTSLQVIMSSDGEAYYYPRLSHLNLWQQSNEIVDITLEIARAAYSSKKTGLK